MGLAGGVSLAGLAVVGLFGVLFARSVEAAPVAVDPERGKYLFQAAACGACHGQNLAGWREGGPTEQPASAPYGELFTRSYGRVPASNITPDPETGIGSWTDEQLITAIRDGRRPNGEQLVSLMPFPHYHQMADADLADLVAYLRTVPAVRNAVPARSLTGPAPTVPELVAPPAEAPTEGVERGAYLVNSVAACGHCHTPLLPDGSPDLSRQLSGNIIPRGVDEDLAPNITPHPARGIGRWTDDEVTALLRTGIGPEGGKVGGLMRLMIENSPWGGFNQLTDPDLRAIVAYLRTVPPIGAAGDPSPGP